MNPYWRLALKVPEAGVWDFACSSVFQVPGKTPPFIVPVKLILCPAAQLTSPVLGPPPLIQRQPNTSLKFLELQQVWAWNYYPFFSPFVRRLPSELETGVIIPQAAYFDQDFRAITSSKSCSQKTFIGEHSERRTEIVQRKERPHVAPIRTASEMDAKIVIPPLVQVPVYRKIAQKVAELRHLNMTFAGTRYYGYYANRVRGARHRRGGAADPPRTRRVRSSTRCRSRCEKRGAAGPSSCGRSSRSTRCGVPSVAPRCASSRSSRSAP